MEIPAIPQPTFYIFKCEHRSAPGIPKPSCVNEQSRDLFDHLSQEMMRKGIMGPVLAIKTSCLGRCQMGPLMIIEPGHHMYCQLSKEKIDRIIKEHIIDGNIVEEFLIPKQYWGDSIVLNKT